MEKHASRSPLIEGRDIGLLVILACLALGACLPERHWHAFARRVAQWRAGKRGSLGDAERSVIRALVGNRSSNWIETSYLRDWLGQRYLAWLQLLACCPPRAWRPGAVLEGKDHLHAALAEGRGAIIWTATFAHNDLHTKAALAESGYRAHLLSRPSHGFSGSRFGRRFLNPLYHDVERKFMGDNIVIDEQGTVEALADVKRRLARNELVIIYVVPLGRRVATRPFLHGRIHIATGVLNLACETGAAILPAFTTARSDGRIVTSLAEALPAPADRVRTDVIEGMLDTFIPELEAWVKDYPEQFAFPLSAADGQMLVSPSDPLPTPADPSLSPDHAIDRLGAALLDR